MKSLQQILLNLKTGTRKLIFGETYALPLDAFRIAVGLVSFAYFFLHVYQFNDFHSSDGLIDHNLVRTFLPVSKFNFIGPDTSETVIYLLLFTALASSIGVVVGVRIKLCAILQFLVCSALLRRNLLVASIDDGVIHLLNLWLVLLPVGHTLTCNALKGKDFRSALVKWAHVRIPGLTVRLFLVNMSAIYWIPAFWKLSSPMWKSGFALYPILKMPISYVGDLIVPEHLEIIRILTFIALISEFLIPVLYLFPAHFRIRLLGLPIQIGFHLAIIATLPIAITNVAMLASPLLYFREEGMRWLLRKMSSSEPEERLAMKGFRWTSLGAATLALLVIVSCLPSVIRKPAQAALWVTGVSQNYRLFNWIDYFNFAIKEEKIVVDDVLQEHGSFPLPNSLRAKILSLNLIGKSWYKEPSSEIQDSIAGRALTRYCQENQIHGKVSWTFNIYLVNEKNIRTMKPDRIFSARMNCENNNHFILEHRKLSYMGSTEW